MNIFKLSESIVNQLVDAACRGIGAAALPLVDAVRNEINKQMSIQESEEISVIEKKEDVSS